MLATVALVAIVSATYAPVVRNTYIWDDDSYVTRNLNLRSLEGLWSIWFEPRTSPQYYPLVHSTFWLEYHLWELAPLGYHVVNVALHAASVLLLWRLLVRLAIPGAWLAAALFAVHPVAVESVAWATERKNVLSLVLALCSLHCYLRFAPADEDAEGTTSRTARWMWYALALLLFVLALLSKTVVASLPAVLLVIYWWKRGRISLRDVAPLMPFFAVGAGLGLVTAWIERMHVGATGEEWSFTPIERSLIAGRAVWFYAVKICWPHPIIFFYPRWVIDDRAWWQYLFPTSALALVVALWLMRGQIGRGPLAAALIFGGVLFPAIGFLNVFPHRFSFVADHFQYHASLALFALAGSVVASLAGRLAARRDRSTSSGVAAGGGTPSIPWRSGMSIAAAVLVLALAAISFRQTFVYRDLHSLYGDVIAKNPSSPTAHLNLGAQLVRDGRRAESLQMFREALRLEPERAIGHANYGQALMDMGVRDGFEPGQLQEAIEYFEKALRVDPNWLPAQVGIAHALIRDRQTSRAREYLTQALSLRPDHGPALLAMGVLLIEDKDWPQSQIYFETAALVMPNAAEAHHGIGVALTNQGRHQEAIPHLQTALQLNPDLYEAHYVLANTLRSLNDFRTAVDQYNEALRIKPDYLDALSNLGVTLGQLGDFQGAVACFERLVRLDPGNVAARMGLGTAMLQTAQWREAIHQFELALQSPDTPPREVAIISNNLAWLFATSAEDGIRDVARAQELARAAVRLEPESGGFWNTLGVAEYRAGSWEQSIVAIEKSIALRDGGDAVDRFVMAMACHQAGRHAEARQWYEKGVSWSAQHQPISANAKRFQQEAADLLRRK